MSFQVCKQRTTSTSVSGWRKHFCSSFGRRYSALVEKFRCSIHEENAVFKRITIKVEESNSPVCTSALLALPRYGKRVVPCDVDIPVSPTSMPSKRQKQKKSVEKSNTIRSVSATFDAGGESLRARLPNTSFTRVIDGKIFKYANPVNCYCKNVLLLYKS